MFGGEKFKKIHTLYNQADQGECFIVFNSPNFWKLAFIKEMLLSC